MVAIVGTWARLTSLEDAGSSDWDDDDLTA